MSDTEGQDEPQQGGEFAPSAGRAGKVEGDQAAFMLMEEILERLKLLNYERNFFPKGFSPLTRTFFALPSSNPAEQFHYFTTLATWLMNLLGNDCKMPTHYDDPNSTVNNLVLELKKLGVPNDYPPIKVKQGHGDAVCAILLSLLERIGHEWQKPFHPPDDGADEATVDDGATLDAEGIADEIGNETEDEEDLYFGAAGVAPKDDGPRQPMTTIESSIEPEAWQLELERVLPQLKLQAAADGKEWRTHIAQAKAHHEAVAQKLPGSAGALEKIHAELKETLEQVDKLQAKLSKDCSEGLADYAAKQEQFAARQEEHARSSEAIGKLQKTLADVTEELAVIKARMDERGSAMTDTSPVVNIKSALQKLKKETRDMEVRIGVVSHTLTLKQLGSSSMTARTALQPSILGGM